MTGRVSISGGKMQVIGVDGLVRFDTDDGLFHVINTVTGTLTVPNLSFPSNTNVNQTDDYVLGTCTAGCTDVIGSIKFTGGTYAAGMPFEKWMSVMGGSVLWLIDGHYTTTLTPDPNINIYQLVTYSFFVDGTNVKMRRRGLNSKQASGSLVISHSIDYKLKVGLYT